METATETIPAAKTEVKTEVVTPDTLMEKEFPIRFGYRRRIHISCGKMPIELIIWTKTELWKAGL